MSKKKDLIAENEKLKAELVTVTEQLEKKPEEVKKDAEELAKLNAEIAENKKLLEEARAKEKKQNASILGGETVAKVTDEKLAETKKRLKGILNG